MLEGDRDLRIGHRVTRCEVLGGVALERGMLDRPVANALRRHGPAGTGERDGRGQGGRQAAAREPGRHVGPAGDAAGHRHAAGTEQLGQRISGPGRRPAAAVQPHRLLAVTNDDREQVAAGAALVRLGDGQHARRGQRRVDRVAALLDRADAGQRGQWLAGRDHPPAAGGRRSRWAGREHRRGW
jgi:hypothetical protein